MTSSGGNYGKVSKCGMAALIDVLHFLPPLKHIDEILDSPLSNAANKNFSKQKAQNIIRTRKEMNERKKNDPRADALSPVGYSDFLIRYKPLSRPQVHHVHVAAYMTCISLRFSQRQIDSPSRKYAGYNTFWKKYFVLAMGITE